MSLVYQGVWKGGVWAPTVWAQGVWLEGDVPDIGLGGYSASRKKRKKKLIYYSDLAAREAQEKELFSARVVQPKPIKIRPTHPDLNEVLAETSDNLITMVDAQNRIAHRLIKEEMERQADEEDAIMILASLL